MIGEVNWHRGTVSSVWNRISGPSQTEMLHQELGLLGAFGDLTVGLERGKIIPHQLFF